MELHRKAGTHTEEYTRHQRMSKVSVRLGHIAEAEEVELGVSTTPCGMDGE